MPEKMLPLGQSDFRSLRDNNYIYVDKTDFVAKLIKEGSFYFLSRPRRFGKSTLLSTLQAYFEDGIKAFAGLKLSERKDLPDYKSCKVLRLDLNRLKEPTIENFSYRFKYYLSLKLKEIGIVVEDDSRAEPSDLFEQALYKLGETKLILLIDEYDAPLTAVFDDEKKFTVRRGVLNDFFTTIKANVGFCNFIFMTGVARFSQLSIFSDFNILKDISFDPDYGSIVGYTNEEIEQYFNEYIEQASQILNAKYQTKAYNKEIIIDKLKLNYDGYSFDESANCHIYNPWSIIHFFSSPTREFKAYWNLSGTAYPALLRNYIEKILKEPVDFDIFKLDSSIDSTEEDLSPKFLKMPSTLNELYGILYQAGYFSIKAYNNITEVITIGIPNLEVKKTFAKMVLSVMSKAQEASKISSYANTIAHELMTYNFDSLKQSLDRLFNEMSYENIKTVNELFFRDLIKLCFLFFGLNPQTEVHSALGRADLIITSKESMYVFEIKVATKRDDVESKRQEAIEQLIKRKYADRLTEHKIVPLVMVILNEAKSKTSDAKLEVSVLEDLRHKVLTKEQNKEEVESTHP